jgi:DNA polymerase I-like protein with 3'-5' exonuclease and polymerase domains
MLFDVNKLARKDALHIGQYTPIPETDWHPPVGLPNLDAAVLLSFDVETYDPNLLDYGPGWGRGPGQGHIVGVALAAMAANGEIGQWYYPLRHEVESHLNWEPAPFFRWLDMQMRRPVAKIGANIGYDLGWLRAEGVTVAGPLHDVQVAEALLTEDGRVGLDHLAAKYLGEHKEKAVLYDWLRKNYGGSEKEQRGNIYRSPVTLAGPYGEADANLPIRIFQKQWPLIEWEQLADVYWMEMSLTPLLVEMRWKGVRVDVKRAYQVYDELTQAIAEKQALLDIDAGTHVNVSSGRDVAAYFKAKGMIVPTTPAGNPSVTAEWLNNQLDPAAEAVKYLRVLFKVRDTFVKGYIIENCANSGKDTIHTTFHQLRGEGGGTRSGRYASSDPNLQNIPVRTKEGKIVRSLIIPDVGHDCIESADYSQIEYRFLAHYATGPGSDELRAAYNADPKTDYHDATYYRICDVKGWDKNDDAMKARWRKPTKNINFGLLYGAGRPKIQRMLQLSDEDADLLFDGYHKASPYVSATMRDTSNEAARNGYITTILGRRSRFETWEPFRKRGEGRKKPLPMDQAIRFYGEGIQRSQLHKAINRRLQGSAADLMKRAMSRLWAEGVYDYIGVPRLTVHDENVHSVIDLSPQQNEAYRYAHHVMETCISISVPIVVDHKRNPTWMEVAKE